MSWVVVIWSLVAGACLTLATVHLIAWVRRTEALSNLMFSTVAVATAGMAACELLMMFPRSLDDYTVLLQWYNFSRWLVTVALVGFIHFYLRAGRPWLELLVVALRTAGLILNFLVSPSVYYISIENLRTVQFLGETVTVVDGIPNPTVLFSQVSLLVLAVYLVDTTLRAHRAGAGNRALRIGLGSVFFVLALSLQMILVLWGFIETPISASLFFLAILGVMSFELGSDVLRAAKLSTTLQAREKELRRERDLSNAVFENAPGLIQLHSPEGKILRWNSGGKPPSAFWELFHKDDRPKAEQAWRSALTNGRSEFELRLDGGESKSRNFFFTAAGADIDGAPHVVAVGVDTTALQDLAAEFARQREDLAHLAKVAAVSELSSSLAHEINQPLAIILSNAEAAQRLLAGVNPDIAEVRDILADIVEADVRAANVIRRLRSILRRGEPQLESVSAAELAGHAVAMAQPDIAAAGASVSLSIPKRLPDFQGDRIPLEQVLLNLVKNACEAMAGNGAAPARLAVSCTAENGFVEFAVRDSGCGLPENAGSIFEAFQTTKPKGLGLGLKICRSIVQAHGGRVWAENNKGRGATFRFTIPQTLQTP